MDGDERDRKSLEARARLAQFCSDGQGIADLDDDAGASPVVEQILDDDPSQSYRFCDGDDLEGSLGGDVGIELSEEDCADMLDADDPDYVRENLTAYIADADQCMEAEDALDFAEGYMRISRAPRRETDYVISLLRAELQSRVQKRQEYDRPCDDMPGDGYDDGEDDDDEEFSEEELIGAGRDIEAALHTEEPVIMMKDEVVGLIEEYRTDYDV